MFRLNILLCAIVSLIAITPASAAPIGYSLYQDGSGSTQLYSIDFSTGTPTPVGDSFNTFANGFGTFPVSLTSHAGNFLVLGRISNGNRLYSMPTTGGAPSYVGPLGVNSFFGGGLASNGSNLYALLPNAGQEGALYSVDPTTGAATPIGDPTGNPFADGLAINSSGRMVATDGDASGSVGNGAVYDVDSTTGLLSFINSLDLGGEFGDSSIAFDPDDENTIWMLLHDSGAYFSIDLTTGTVSPLSYLNGVPEYEGNGGYWRGLAFLQPTATPEPATVILFGAVSGVGLLIRARRRKA